ncbi:ras and Rab interactor 1 [Rhineura floridana]|uniref:ras and Rab interactor 1 n=1 Tax=Rhineura floridana TaxID=261503 RepID=UPI002AC84D43|nr:ras and Rab interactor 1 [Rhineura floridana]
MTRNPIYDYPEPYANPRHKTVAFPRNISLVGRLRLTQPVWLQLGINSATALHILQREPPGTFLVRRSNTRQCQVLCLRLPDNSSPAFVTTCRLCQERAGISLEGSDLTFPSLLHLIASYCTTPDILPLALRLPRPIWEASSCQQLEAIAHLGLEFWNSSLNTKEFTRPTPPGPPSSMDTDPPLDPMRSTQSQNCAELVCGQPTGARDIPTLPLDGPPRRDVGARRQHFKNVKIQVSTEAASPLSPPAAPPPPIPVGKKKKKNLPALPQSPVPSGGSQPSNCNPFQDSSQATVRLETYCIPQRKEEETMAPPGVPVPSSGQLLCVDEENQPEVCFQGYFPRNIPAQERDGLSDGVQGFLHLPEISGAGLFGNFDAVSKDQKAFPKKTTVSELFEEEVNDS